MGAVQSSDGAVFLRVWQDEQHKIDGSWFAKITFSEFYKHNPSNLGYDERLTHVELIRSGTPSYLVMCQAQDINASPRKAASFNRNEVFVGGRLVDKGGDYWLEWIARQSVSAIRSGACSVTD